MARVNKAAVYVVPVEGNVGKLSYARALRRIRRARFVDDVVTAFFKREEASICAVITIIENKRVLVLNDNTSLESVSSALNTIISNEKDEKFVEAMNSGKNISLQSAY